MIPSEAKATLDVRMLPDEIPEKFLELVESELHRFVRFSWDVVVNLARAR